MASYASCGSVITAASDGQGGVRPYCVDVHQRPVDLSDDDIVGLPIDVLAIHLLQGLAQESGHGDTHNVYNTLNGWRHAGIDSNGPVMRALTEAYDWLNHRGLIADNSQGSPHPGFITRLGRQVLEQGAALLGAIDRLGDDLHHDLVHVRSQFLLGQYELAAFAAMKTVEVRVREAGGFENADIGVPMMRRAFNADNGPLTDQDAEGGERQGMSDLFAGAFAVFKNPTSHRVVTFDDPAEAADVVSLASLLLRILDKRT